MASTSIYDIAVCGAGIAGIATAYHLAASGGVRRVVLIDECQPLSFTTSSSGENFRDCWPHPQMTSLMRESIARMEQLAEESGNAFSLRFSGYDFVSETAPGQTRSAARAQSEGSADACSVVSDSMRIRSEYPYLSRSIVQVVHVERAGAFDVYALGSLLLDRARRGGTELLRARVTAIRQTPWGGFALALRGTAAVDHVEAEQLVIAAGPFSVELAAMLGIRLPLENVLQRKIVIPDPLGIVPRDMPFTVCADRLRLDWSEEERELISAEPAYEWLLQPFPAGLHIKPQPGNRIKLGWAYNRRAEPPRREFHDDTDFPNVVIRGASRFIPGLRPYVDELPTPVVQIAGYYSRTLENWPLIGPLELDGAYTISALSGFGTMAACAAGASCAAWLTGAPLPDHARYFHPGRYSDSRILGEIGRLDSDGQL